MAEKPCASFGKGILLPYGGGLEDELLPTLADIEERYVLDRVGGNKRRAAALLDIRRRTLYRRLEASPLHDPVPLRPTW